MTVCNIVICRPQGKEKEEKTYQFPFIVRLIILRNQRNLNGGTMILNRSIGLEKDKRERGRRTSCFFDCIARVESLSVHPFNALGLTPWSKQDPTNYDSYSSAPHSE